MVKSAFVNAGAHPVSIDVIDQKYLVKKGTTGTPTEPLAEAKACDKCGRKPNPLVAMGLVPPSLQHALLPPSLPDVEKEKEKKISKLRVPGSRVLTGGSTNTGET